MNSKKTSQLRALSVESLIHTVRGERVIIDTDLAKVYGIPTFRLNEVVSATRIASRKIFSFSSQRMSTQV